jgi:iron-sulfur cluster repair protein YtfE (RIC family)
MTTTAHTLTTAIGPARQGEAPRPAADALAEILEDHARIRTLLGSALEVAEQAIAGHPPARALLPHLLYGIRVTLERHLAFEEAILVPILTEDLPVGPQRARALEEEHRRQRAEIAALSDARAADDLGALVCNLRTLVRDFLADMAIEERELLRGDVVRDDLVSVDQCTG